MSAGLSNGPGLSQGYGLEWIAGLFGGPGLTVNYSLSSPVNQSVPTIAGPAIVGVQETGSNGAWSGSPTSYTYQWNGGGTPISGATSINYTPVSGDIGTVLTLTVTAHNSAGNSSPATSSGSPIVASDASGRSIGTLLSLTYA